MALIDDIVAHHPDATERYELAAQIATNLRIRGEYARAQDAKVRYCPACDEVKLTSAFGRDAAQPSGLASRCRDCRRRV